MNAVSCCIEGCFRPQFRQGLCFGHLKRKQRGVRVDVDLRSISQDEWNRLIEAVLRFNEILASDDIGWIRARDSLRKSALNYALSLPAVKTAIGEDRAGEMKKRINGVRTSKEKRKAK